MCGYLTKIDNASPQESRTGILVFPRMAYAVLGGAVAVPDPFQDRQKTTVFISQLKFTLAASQYP